MPPPGTMIWWRFKTPQPTAYRFGYVTYVSRNLIRMGRWKLIMGLGSGGFSKPSRIKPVAGGPVGQLYHLGDDPGETTNLYQRHRDVVQRLEKELSRIRGSD